MTCMHAFLIPKHVSSLWQHLLSHAAVLQTAFAVLYCLVYVKVHILVRELHCEVPCSIQAVTSVVAYQRQLTNVIRD